jgi:hypothetical protein
MSLQVLFEGMKSGKVEKVEKAHFLTLPLFYQHRL